MTDWRINQLESSLVNNLAYVSTYREINEIGAELATRYRSCISGVPSTTCGQFCGRAFFLLATKKRSSETS